MLNLLHKGDTPVSRETQGLATYLVPLSRLVDNTYQPRQHNDADHVLGIAKSLLDLRPTLPETRGLQQVPIGRIMRWSDSTCINPAVYDDPDEVRRLIADPEYVVEMAFGHSRRLAFDCLSNGVASVFPQYAGAEQVAFNGREFNPADFAEMPIVLLSLFDEDMWRQAAIENAARRDISAIEQAQALRRAIDELGMTITEAAATIDMSRSAASNLLRLLELPQEYQQAIINGQMSETHGRTLLAMRPAPHLVKDTPEELGAMTRKDLETHVAKLISGCQPLPSQPRSGYRMAYGYHNDLGTRQVDPPAWSYDWQPPAQDGIVGACEGCQWRATFAGDPGPRCTQFVRRGGPRYCHELKTEAWLAQQRDLQRAAIQRPAAPPAASVSRETPANVYTPASESSLTAPTWFVQGQSWGAAPAALIDKGLCGPEKCACFVVAFNQYAKDEHVRPDPTNAPNMCYGCTSAQRLARRKQELEHGDISAKRAAIKAQNAACTELLRDAFYVLTAQDLWHNNEFMRDMLKASSLANGLGQRANQISSMDALAIQEIVWMHIAKETCTNWSQFQVDGDSRHWDMPKVQKWLKRIGAEFARPVGGVWAELLAPAETEHTTELEDL
jgi:ParB-like chromosome segregation protein Spo0J